MSFSAELKSAAAATVTSAEVFWDCATLPANKRNIPSQTTASAKRNAFIEVDSPSCCDLKRNCKGCSLRFRRKPFFPKWATPQRFHTFYIDSSSAPFHTVG